MSGSGALAHLLQAFAEPTRLTIVEHLLTGEHRVRDLVEHIGLAQATVSQHVAFLSACGVLRARPEGRSTWYALAAPSRVEALLAAAQALAADDPHRAAGLSGGRT